MIIGNDRVTAVEVERTMIDSEGFVVGKGVAPPCPLILWCVRSATAACRCPVFPSTRAPDAFHMPKAE